MVTTSLPRVAADGSTKARRRRSSLDRATATRLAATEYDRWARLLGELDPADWRQATDCPAWDVRQMTAHVVGMVEMWASVREQVRQMRAAGKAKDGLFIDALTALQVRERDSATPAELIERLRVSAPRAVRQRRRLSRLAGSRLLRPKQDLGPVDGAEWWALSYVTDVILTRDAWMHRVDLTRAVGREMELTAGHDAVLIADAVADWAGRHHQPCTLTLAGPAGGTWQFGAGGPELTCDAVEFARSITWRERRDGLLGEFVPF